MSKGIPDSLMTFYVYMLECSDQSFYVGNTDDLEVRIAKHEQGTYGDGYTHERLPVRLVWYADFPTRDEALNRERQIKKWSRAKKVALIRQDWERIRELARKRGRPSTRSALARAPAQGERVGK